MRIIIEDYPYGEQELRGIIPARMLDFPNKHGEIRLPYVGYCFYREINDCIFFLPKVVLSEGGSGAGRGLVLDRYDPVKLLDFSKSNVTASDKQFIQQFAIWIYRAISIFYRNTNTSIVSRHSYVNIDASAGKVECSLIDSILSLARFARDNRNFVMFEVKNIHSGYNRVNWKKTVNHQLPVKQGKSPVYLNPVNKRKQIDFDEELFVIFYSILNYVHSEYGFPVEINYNYEVIKNAEFRHYLKGYGKRRLRQIKYKYFTDKALELWHLCYSFFDCSDRLYSSCTAEDYLVAKDFNIVFEAIVDALIGEEVPSGFKFQNDGKIVDHIYPYNSLVCPERQVYYIADSKYYKVGASLGLEAVYKQYTYAKNVIQLTFDILHGKGDDDYKRLRGFLPYRDDVTEGYNITPNFFISAKIGSGASRGRYSYAADNLRPHDGDNEGNPVMKHLAYHFENRLFDRDTLILSHYDINFLYLIALYGRNNRMEQTAFRNHVRDVFRSYVITLLERYYDFYRFNIHPEEVEPFVNAHFRELSGKIFHFDGKLIMALRRDAIESESLRHKYGEYLLEYSLS